MEPRAEGTVNGWSIQGEMLVTYQNGVVMTVTMGAEKPGEGPRENMVRHARRESRESGDRIEMAYNPQAPELAGQSIIVRMTEDGEPVLTTKMRPSSREENMTLEDVAMSASPEEMFHCLIISEMEMEDAGIVRPED